jgi:hypothetical protein
MGSSLLLDLSSTLVRRNLIELRLYEGRSLGVCPGCQFSIPVKIDADVRQ